MRRGRQRSPRNRTDRAKRGRRLVKWRDCSRTGGIVAEHVRDVPGGGGEAGVSTTPYGMVVDDDLAPADAVARRSRCARSMADRGRAELGVVGAAGAARAGCVCRPPWPSRNAQLGGVDGAASPARRRPSARAAAGSRRRSRSRSAAASVGSTAARRRCDRRGPAWTWGSRPGRGRRKRPRPCVSISIREYWLTVKLPSGCAPASTAATPLSGREGDPGGRRAVSARPPERVEQGPRGGRVDRVEARVGRQRPGERRCGPWASSPAQAAIAPRW